MHSAKHFLKTAIAKTLSAGLQHRIRRAYLVRQALADRPFHEKEMVALKSFIAPGDLVADIGANVGAYTKELSALTEEAGAVLAFEPVAANFDILQAVIHKAGLRNVRAFPLALGARVEQREIAIPALDGFTGYYWARFAKPGEVGEKVEVSTLDVLASQGSMSRIDFIKCDVEGSELEVLRGGLDLLRTHTPALLIEVSLATSDDVFALLKSLGYKAFVYDGELVLTEAYRDKQFSNYFFFHPASKMWRRLWPGQPGARTQAP
jgi:FkbM family methyltransferase